MLKPFEPCDKCKDTSDGSPPGYYFEIAPKKFKFAPKVLVKCTCREKYEQYLLLFDMLIHRGFDPEIHEYSIADSYKGTKSLPEIERLRKWMMGVQMKELPYRAARLLYFWGDHGTQKTHVAQWVGRVFIASIYADTWYIDMQSLLDIVVQYRADPVQTAERQRYENVKVLIIDEFFAAVGLWKSGGQMPFLEEFLRRRLNNDCITIIVANDYYTDLKGTEESTIPNLIARTVKTLGAEFKFEDVYTNELESYDVRKGLF